MRAKIIWRDNKYFGLIGKIILIENDVYYIEFKDGIFPFLSKHIEILTTLN